MICVVVKFKVAKVSQVNGEVLFNPLHVALQYHLEYLDDEAAVVLQHHAVVRVSLHLDHQEPAPHHPVVESL